MFKNSAIRRICVATIALFILLLIYLFPTTPKINEELSYIKYNEMPVFLLDNNNYVAKSTIIKENNEIEKNIEEIIMALTINSKKSNYIKNGFHPIIPENTKLIDYVLDNDTLTLNFSKEFLNINKELEEKLLEALTYSLTEIKNIKKIKILVDGEQLKFSNIIIPEYLDRSYGINKIYNINSIKNLQKTTIYYIGKINNEHYYIPITKITNNTLEKVEIIIKELQTTPIHNTNLISYLKASTLLSNYEILEKSVILSFNNYLLANLQNKDILEEVKYAIALSIKDTYGINEVIFNIPDMEEDKIEI